jgi:hypothetical protein
VGLGVDSTGAGVVAGAGRPDGAADATGLAVGVADLPGVTAPGVADDVAGCGVGVGVTTG